jgi:large subunit ribosomal protein L19
MAITQNYLISPVDVAQRRAVDIRPGDTVRVYLKIQEKGKTRLQLFEGLIIARKHGTEPGGTFTVRKVASGVGTEKIFPLYSPIIDKIEVVKRSPVRRSKLYYIRDKATKQIRKKMRALSGFVWEQPADTPEPVADEPTTEAPAEPTEVVEDEVVEEVKTEEKPVESSN